MKIQARLFVVQVSTCFALNAAAQSVSLDDAFDALSKQGCNQCHRAETSDIGPSIKEMRARNQPVGGWTTDVRLKVTGELKNKIANGASGKYGSAKMPPQTQLTPFEVQNLARVILGMRPVPSDMSARTDPGGRSSGTKAGSPGSPAPPAPPPVNPGCVSVRQQFNYQFGRSLEGFFTNNCGGCVIVTWRDQGSAGYVQDRTTRLEAGTANHREAFSIGGNGPWNFLVTRVERC